MNHPVYPCAAEWICEKMDSTDAMSSTSPGRLYCTTGITHQHTLPHCRSWNLRMFYFSKQKRSRIPPRHVTLLVIWMFPKIGVSQNGWFIMENPIWMGWFWGVPLFSRKHPYQSHIICSMGLKYVYLHFPIDFNISSAKMFNRPIRRI